ncbi:MAG: hypothetical protein H7Y41_02330 [Hyphomonadaceae bacterium]|nr:hypothetical protein [Clostridia bacterium]
MNKNQVLFFDMADFSVRTDILEAIELVNAFSAYYKVIFGLNENEAIALYKQFNPGAALPDLKTIGQNIFDTMDVDCFVIHTLTNAIAWEKGAISETESLYVAQPKLSTGGGDNFNGGLCFGLLIGLDMEGSLYTANATSGYYVRNAKSPTVEDLMDTLNHWDDLIERP